VTHCDARLSNPIMKISLLSAALLLSTSLATLALDLRVIPWDDEVAERKFALGRGKEPAPIGYLHPSARSEPVKVPSGEAPLVLQALDRLDDKGKPLGVPVRIGSSIRKPLLLILPDKGHPTGIKPLILEDDLASFKWGTIRLINVTPKSLAFRWGKNAKAVPSGWKPVDVSPGGDSRNMEVFLYLKEDLKKPLYSAVWEHREDMRQMVFMVPSKDAALGPVEFKFVNELRIEDTGAE